MQDFLGQVILTKTGCIDILESEESEVLSKFSLFLIPSNSYLVPEECTGRFVKSTRIDIARIHNKPLSDMDMIP